MNCFETSGPKTASGQKETESAAALPQVERKPPGARIKLPAVVSAIRAPEFPSAKPPLCEIRDRLFVDDMTIN